MGNAVGSIASGVGQVVGNILGHPLDFLSGKSCNSACAPTWDFFCYIENFCVPQLMKFVMVAMLVYFVLLFLYLLFNLGIFQCICRTLCHMVWAFLSTYVSALNCCCTYCCHKLRSVKSRRRRRRRDVEESAGQSSSSGSEDGYAFRPQYRKRRNYKDEHLRRSLRPNSHRPRLELSGINSHHLHRKKNVDDHVRVTRTSKFSRKGSKLRSRTHHRHRR